MSKKPPKGEKKRKKRKKKRKEKERKRIRKTKEKKKRKREKREGERPAAKRERERECTAAREGGGKATRATTNRRDPLSPPSTSVTPGKLPKPVFRMVFISYFKNSFEN